MYLERLLQINVACMAALGTALLGLGQPDTSWPVWMFLAAFASVWLTDFKGWVRLNRLVTAGAALVALAALVWQTLQAGGVEIASIGRFLIYLQLILLFQKKEFRTYGQLALLSLLQVVVAAIFYQSVLFGVLLVVYLFVGLSALTLLFLHCERNRKQPQPAPRAVPSTAGAPALPQILLDFAAAAARLRQMMTGRPMRDRAGPGRLEEAAAESARWPLAGQQATFRDATGGYAGQAGVGRELPLRVARMGLGTLAATLALFAVLPRWGHDPWRGAFTTQRHTVGFSPKVRLGELGKIIESPEEVLRIQFSDLATDQPYQVLGNVYLHGTVLTHYQQGTWQYRGPPSWPRPVDAAPPQRVEAFVRQTIEIVPLDRPELFCVWPFVKTRPEQYLLSDPLRRVLLRQQRHANKRFLYELATTAFDKGMQTRLAPATQRELAGLPFLLDPPATQGPGATPRLVALAEQCVKRSGVDKGDHFRCASLLESRLRDAGQFQYSLEGQKRDPSLDPIEDFVTNNPRGHCEYFATALVLMLRSQGIPARLTVGYKTNEWNRAGRFFQVRQLHAHTWVEAYLDKKHLSGRVFPDDPRWKNAPGAWLRLDPTPGVSAPQGNSLLEAIGGAFSWLDFIWTNYVMEMDRSRQQRAVYDPVADAVKKLVAPLADPKWWRSLLSKVGAALGIGLRGLVGGLVAVGVTLVLLLLYHGLRLLWRRWLWRLFAPAGPATPGARSPVEFYRRLEAVLARFGLRRAASQTQREFARQAGPQIAASTGQHQLALLPGQVVEAFYQVRFGGLPLDSPQTQAVENALRQLRQAAVAKLAEGVSP